MSAVLRIDVDLDELRDELIDEWNESRDESARVERWIMRIWHELKIMHSKI